MYDYNNNMPIFSYVMGIDGAKQFQLMPNRSAILMDNQEDIFYFKNCNQMGQYSIKAYKFEEIKEPKQTEYASVEQLNELKSLIEKMLKKEGEGNA